MLLFLIPFHCRHRCHFESSGWNFHCAFFLLDAIGRCAYFLLYSLSFFFCSFAFAQLIPFDVFLCMIFPDIFRFIVTMSIINVVHCMRCPLIHRFYFDVMVRERAKGIEERVIVFVLHHMLNFVRCVASSLHCSISRLVPSL